MHVYADELARPRDTPQHFTVDVYDDRGGIIETMAQCSSLLVGRAAFAQAIKERPTLKVTLRQGIRVIEKQDAQDGVGRRIMQPGVTDGTSA